MKKLILILLLFPAFQRKGYTQDIVHSKVHFTSKEENRVVVNTTYNYTFTAIDSNHNPLLFQVHNLPGWLHYNKTNHSISGKPVKAGQYMIDITATTFDTLVHQRFMLTVCNKKTINILTLGNSITNGTGKYNSYRRALWQMLHNANYNFDFIGSWSLHHMGGDVPNPDFDMDHDGHSGWKASDILSQPDWDKQRGNIHDWIKNYTPDIVLLELGTNEVFQCVTTQDAINNISAIMAILRKKNSNVKIFVAQIPPLGKQWIDKKLCGNDITYGEALINFNKQVTILTKEKNSNISRVILVDQYSGINATTDMYDDIHPNNIGEKKMAERWYRAINTYMEKL